MAGLISQATIEQVRAANEIVEVIGSYIPLKRAGANFRALCPFHKEKTPSFNVNPQQQIFKCFGCGKGGNVFSFVMEYESIGFVDAIRRLAERAKIPIELDNQPGQQQARHIKDQLLDLHEQLAQRWQNCLAGEAAGQRARDYLAQRGVSGDAIKLFRIGAAPEKWDDTVNWARGKKFEMEVAEKAGVIIRKEETGNYYDRFRGRLMFPICDEQGRVIGFSGRVLPGDDSPAKYVNSPETPIFKKSKVFFGLDKSKRALLDANVAIVCEGQIDLIACFMSGVKNVVAPQGTAFTAEHAGILKRYVEKIVLCFDSDRAGQTATVRSLNPLLESGPELIFRQEVSGSSRVGTRTKEVFHPLLPTGLAIAVATMPSPHDPDSYIKAFGAGSFQKLIDDAQDFFDFYLDHLCATNAIESERGQRTIVQEMAEALQKTGNEVLLDTYAKKTSVRLGVSMEAVRNEFRKVRPPENRSAQSEDEVETPVESGPPPSQQELWLLRLLLESDSFVEWTAAHLNLEWLPHRGVREIISLRLEAHKTDSWPGLAAWLSEVNNSNWQSLITEILTDARSIPDPETVMKGSPQRPGVVQLLRDKFVERQLAALNQRLARPDSSDAEKMETLNEIQALRKMKQQPITS